jgi:hypothetical protein
MPATTDRKVISYGSNCGQNYTDCAWPLLQQVSSQTGLEKTGLDVALAGEAALRPLRRAILRCGPI